MFNFYKLEKSKIFRIIIIALCVYISIVSVTNIIIASDIDHILYCDEHDCPHCAIIHFCQIQMGFMYLSIPPMVFTLFVLIKQKFTDFLNEINKNKTLVECKIQLNI